MYKKKTKESPGLGATLVGEHKSGWELPASFCCILSWGTIGCAGSMGSGPVGTESRRPLLAHRQVRLQDCVHMFGGWGVRRGASRVSVSRISGYV